MAHRHNFGLALTILLTFWRMKGANRYIKILLVVFQEKISFGAIWIFLGHFLLFDWAWSKLSQVTVTIGSLNTQP